MQPQEEVKKISELLCQCKEMGISLHQPSDFLNARVTGHCK